MGSARPTTITANRPFSFLGLFRLSDRLRLPLPAPAEQIAYAFPSAASSRSRRPAAQIALVPFSCVAFSPSAVFTFTVASSTAYDPRTTRPLNTVVISLQTIGVATTHPDTGGEHHEAAGIVAEAIVRNLLTGINFPVFPQSLTRRPRGGIACNFIVGETLGSHLPNTFHNRRNARDAG